MSLKVVTIVLRFLTLGMKELVKSYFKSLFIATYTNILEYVHKS